MINSVRVESMSQRLSERDEKNKMGGFEPSTNSKKHDTEKKGEGNKGMLSASSRQVISDKKIKESSILTHRVETSR